MSPHGNCFLSAMSMDIDFRETAIVAYRDYDRRSRRDEQAIRATHVGMVLNLTRTKLFA